MNPSMAGFFLNPSPSSLHSTYYHDKEEDSVIDLGLSLRTTLHPQVYHPSSNQFVLPPQGYAELAEWTHGGTKAIQQCGDEEAEGVQSKERWGYLKVNMDGVVVGRKICIYDHSDYRSLAIQLEDLFGRLCLPGLQLFQAESECCLFYMDGKGNWRPAGHVPWKEFVDCVKRLRIVRKSGSGTTHLLSS